MTPCTICKNATATLPEGIPVPRFCPTCWETRLRQVFLEEDRFHIQRVFRSADAEKYVVYHDEHESGGTPVGTVIAVHDTIEDHLEVSAFPYDRMKWTDSVPFIYAQGIECEIAMIDVFLGVLEAELVPSWRTASWAAEVSLCTGDPFWIDSREREPADEPEDDTP